MILPKGTILNFQFSKNEWIDIKIISHTEPIPGVIKDGYEIKLLNCGVCVWLPRSQFIDYENDLEFNNDTKYEQLSLF